MTVATAVAPAAATTTDDDPGPCRLPLGLLGGTRRGRASSTSSSTSSVQAAAAALGPHARYQYTPPDGADGRRTSRWSRWPGARWLRGLRCPACHSPCVTRTLAVLQECADGLGAWPSGRWLSAALCPVLLLLMLWALAYVFVGTPANVDGPLFRLVAMFVCAKLAGWMTRRLADVPALVGMLVVGVAMKSTGYLDLPPGYVDAIGVLRKTALSLIMARAGLGLDPVQLRSLSLLVLGLAVLPAVVEVAAIVGLSHLLLDLPPLWGVLLGLVLAAVAPSVVMPCFLELRARGLGSDKGIDTLVVAAASFDDVIAISLYGLVQSLIFDGGTSAQELVQHPLGLVFGILYGAVLGKTLQLLPTRDAEHLCLWRCALVLSGGLVATFGSEVLGYEGAGSVACIATAFTAAAGWRRREGLLSVQAVEEHFEMLWAVFEPIMFSLIGADINTGVLDGGMVGLAVGCITVSLLFRTLSTWLLLLAGKRFNWKERLFVALAWLPKADVQAALGPLALDTARRALRQDDVSAAAPGAEAEANVDRASTVLLVAVLSILMTAPAGSVVIASLSRRLLNPAPGDTPPPAPAADPADPSRAENGCGVIREAR
ncbi:hypothetical protein ONE63_005582 [Megalurothrips usitatus]|uniref:Sodium/hydrogen exchanger 9B2-like n=1 Tax=Megalurothrips usitatus TaxID=439358 RepID=A0AAV7Y0X5_9NEOP|nr:hypothetical protein ONE63_005582 [Megalurothrips usitatus]